MPRYTENDSLSWQLCSYVPCYCFGSEKKASLGQAGSWRSCPCHKAEAGFEWGNQKLARENNKNTNHRRLPPLLVRSLTHA